MVEQPTLKIVHESSIAGGTGEAFEWQALPELARPVILAGGLNPQNVAMAIKTVWSCGVDVSGGVEQGKEIKSREKMQAFIQEINNARVR